MTQDERRARTRNALLESAASGLASLRFYGWAEAIVSLGYFQTEALRKRDPILNMDAKNIGNVVERHWDARPQASVSANEILHD